MVSYYMFLDVVADVRVQHGGSTLRFAIVVVGSKGREEWR